MKFSFLILAIMLIASPVSAETNEWASAPHIQARIVKDGGHFNIEMQMDDGWYTYYKISGMAGVPTTFDWAGSKDFNVTKVTFPEYEIHDEAGLTTYGYSDEVIFRVDAETGKKPLANVTISGAVCKDICIPYDLKLTKEFPPGKSSRQDDPAGYLAIIITALLAGLILNIMPCVLPVLSLKILSVVKQAGFEKRRARINFLATATGIIVSFWILAALAVALKNAGMAVGWGLHFQSPIFVGILLAIVLTFAASLFGLFHLRPPSWIAGGGSHNTVLGNFFSGMLATVLGTSCTAPILTTAVGFALSRGAFDIFLIFTLMGLGMALPFLLFALIPNIAKYLPKPGKWMVKVKYAMGVLLLLTAAWLGYVLYSQLKTEVVLEKQATGWQVFEEAQIPQLVDSGKTVFVDVTAEWCVNCKANKIGVLDTKEMTQLFAREDIVLLRGDMTKPSKPLLEYIKKFDRYGIPFNIVYGPKFPQGVLLPPLLTKDEVRIAIGKASGK